MLIEVRIPYVQARPKLLELIHSHNLYKSHFSQYLLNIYLRNFKDQTHLNLCLLILLKITTVFIQYIQCRKLCSKPNLNQAASKNRLKFSLILLSVNKSFRITLIKIQKYFIGKVYQLTYNTKK